MVTVETTDTTHGHVDVEDPQWAAIVIDVITDIRGAPPRATVTSWNLEWHCSRCGAWRSEPDPHHR